MRMTDGNRTVDISIKRWNGSGYDPDWAEDYFEAGSLERTEDGTYIVDDVDYCIEMAESTDADGARCRWDENGNAVPDEDMVVFVEEVER